jgi:catechol 2,3-dioxygenase-like lactoylglutathione lyase family enzyme
MLRDTDAVANLAVKDLEVSRKFYQETLGLPEVGSEGEELVVFRSGKSSLNVYRSQFAGTNQATAVTWDVGDEIEDVVRKLKAKGIRFEHYDLPGQKLEGDIHIFDGTKVSWFKDPDGNILNVVGR